MHTYLFVPSQNQNQHVQISTSPICICTVSAHISYHICMYLHKPTHQIMSHHTYISVLPALQWISIMDSVIQWRRSFLICRDLQLSSAHQSWINTECCAVPFNPCDWAFVAFERPVENHNRKFQSNKNRERRPMEDVSVHNNFVECPYERGRLCRMESIKNPVTFVITSIDFSCSAHGGSSKVENEGEVRIIWASFGLTACEAGTSPDPSKRSQSMTVLSDQIIPWPAMTERSDPRKLPRSMKAWLWGVEEWRLKALLPVEGQNRPTQLQRHQEEHF